VAQVRHSTPVHGRLMLAVRGGFAVFERDLVHASTMVKATNARSDAVYGRRIG